MHHCVSSCGADCTVLHYAKQVIILLEISWRKKEKTAHYLVLFKALSISSYCVSTASLSMSWKDNLKNPHSGGGFFCTLLIGRLSIQSLVTLLVLLLGWTPLALILQGNKNEQGAANIPAILVHINMMASHHCCSRFVGCISMMWVSHSITFKKKSALMALKLGTVEARSRIPF